jgi:hypothetical protein
MAGLVPAIHVFAAKYVDARHKAGHDERLKSPPHLDYTDRCN